MTGVLPSMRGESWLAVVSIESEPSGAEINHAQPEPKSAPGAAAAAHCSLNASNEPNEEFMAFASSPVGSPPPLGLMISQNIAWLECPPPLFLTAVLMS